MVTTLQRLRKQIAAVTCALSFAGSTRASAQEIINHATIDVSVASAYVAGKAGFRIVNHPVAQTYIDASTPLGTFFTWSNTRIKETDVNELDLGWISPELPHKYVGARFVFSGYTYPNTGEWGNWDLETGIMVATKQLPIDLNFYGAANLAGTDLSGVMKLTARKTLPLSTALTDTKISLEGAVAYSEQYYSNQSGFSHATLKGELSKDLGSLLQAYGTLLGQKKLNSFDGKIHDELVGSGGLRFTF